MIEISLLTGLATVTCFWIVFRGICWLKSKKFSWKKELMQLLFLINLLVLTRITFYPMETVNGKVQPLIFEAAAIFPLRVNYIPFVNISDYETKFDFLINLVGNSAMFIPTGILLPLIYKRFDRFWKVLLGGAVLSLSIEILQLPFAVRASDIDDLILNVSGCIIGYGLYSLVSAIVCLIRTRKNA